MTENQWKEIKVKFAGGVDEEALPITCVCGYGGYWEFPISVYPDAPDACPKCGREYYFKNDITVSVIGDIDHGLGKKPMVDIKELIDDLPDTMKFKRIN